jgi:hypothetical protein
MPHPPVEISLLRSFAQQPATSGIKEPSATFSRIDSNTFRVMAEMAVRLSAVRRAEQANAIHAISQ